MGLIERRARDRQKRIKEILDASQAAFKNKGFVNATMNDIANISDLSRRTLYLYFHNKEEILLTIAVNTLSELIKQINLKNNSEKKAIDKLMDLANIYRDLFLKNNTSFQFLPNFTNCIKSVGKENEIVKKCENQINQIAGIVTYLLIEGIQDKSIRKFKNPKRTAALLVGMIHSLIQSVEGDYDLLSVAFHIEPEEFINESFNSIYHYLSVDYTG